MKKALIIFGGAGFSQGAFEFARRLNELEPLLLVGVFIPQMSYLGLWAPDPIGGYDFIPLLEEEIKAMKKNSRRFETACRDNKIACRVHATFLNFTMADLKTKTRFSDLLIIGSDKFYENIVGEDPDDYLRDVLHTSECGTIVIPEDFDFPEQNIFTYNGSESSVYAIKQFIYLFPEFSKNQSTIVYAKEDDDAIIPEEDEIKELIQPHLPKADFLKLEIEPKKYFSTWVSEQKHTILIGGSFGRPRIGELFKKSFFNKVIAENFLPVFVAHK
jgi:hypothetical protein